MAEVAQKVHVTQEAVAPMRVRAIVACSLGHFFELFDFVMYGFFAVIIGKLFFPASDPMTSLLSSFATYGVGFLMRPVGAIVIGAYGDRNGRKSALVLTICVMALSTLGIAFLPTYAQIGILAPLLLVACRLIQGFSTGGEWGGAAAFMVEYAPKGTRGWVGSWQNFSGTLGVVAGSVTAAILSSLMDTSSLESWGWRIPFIIGAIAGPVGYYLRRNIDETPAFDRTVANKTVEKNPLSAVLTGYPYNLLVGLGISVFGTAGFYIPFVFLPAFARQTLKIGFSEALYATTIASLVGAILMPIFAGISDRVGRKPMMVVACGTTLLASYPLFAYLSHSPSLMTLIVSQTALVVLAVIFLGPLPAILCELFPTAVRYTALSMSYGLGVMIFGGFAPFIGTYLVNVTGDPISPTYYVMFAAIVSGLVALLFYKETAFKDIQ